MLWIYSGLAIGLCLYSLGYYFAAFKFLFRKTPLELHDLQSESSSPEVCVLVPSRNEGSAVFRVAHSLIDQDYSGFLRVKVLLNDQLDSCVALLRQQYPRLEFSLAAPGEIVLLVTDRRAFHLVYTGLEAKSAKINSAVDRLTEPLVAILDCDHQAHRDWIRTSVDLLTKTKGDVVQGRRSPLAALGFFQLWDSLQQHVGCELFNHFFSDCGLTVFFTGTTAMMKTALLREMRFQPSLTEDTDLSYRLFVRRQQVHFNALSGSDEEVSPDLYSFLARRRRWAHGHTEAFFKHLFSFVKSRQGFVSTLQFVFHGSHYLLAVPIFAVHLILAAALFRSLPFGTQVLSLALGALAGLFLSRSQRTVGGLARTLEFLITSAWFSSAAIFITTLIVYLEFDNISLAGLALPKTLVALGSIGFVAPYFLLICGMFGLQQAGWGSVLAVTLTYPFAFYLDVCAVLIGLMDYVSGAKVWRVISRAPRAATLALEGAYLRPALHIKQSWGASALAQSFRERKSFLWSPTVWLPIAFPFLIFQGAMLTAQQGHGFISKKCEVLPQDKEPWYTPTKKLDLCASPLGPKNLKPAVSQYELVRTDHFEPLDNGFWEPLSTTWDCNRAMFSPKSIASKTGEGLSLKVEDIATGERPFRAGSLVAKDSKSLYGRFEVTMKPAKTSGLVSAFFLYRYNPWQEIDVEFLGRDTTKLMLNVYFNPGEEGDEFNHGSHGTPILIDLGFDAAKTYHNYKVEWDPTEVRWYVDEKLVHRRVAGAPSPIPNLPMRLHMNVWPTCSEELGGPLPLRELPAQANFKEVKISTRKP